jgi:hypothetical protein
MKKNEIVRTAMFSLLLIGTAALGYAQQNDQHGNKDTKDAHAQSSGRQQDQHQPDAQNGSRQNHGSQQPAAQAGPQQNRGQQQQQQRQQATRNDHAQERPVNTTPQHNQPVQQRGDWQQHRATHFDAQHRTWAQRGGYNGYRVPDDRFGTSFGSVHSFRMSGLPYMDVSGYPRFQYDGYWLNMMEPYPEYWGADWDRSDDMYVDFNGGGYYLYDRRFPGRAGVAISISF